MTEPGGTGRTSVVIAAHNEEAVIGRCLDALLADPGPAGVDITVVANGCTDATAAVAGSRPGVRVIDRPEQGKPGALNAGDAVAVGFPRVYLDADIVLPPGAVRVLAEALNRPDDAGTAPLAVVPRRQLDLARRPLLVRAYFAINARLPAYDRALFGRGAIVLSARGRARFAGFPDMIADDLYLDSLFTWDERREISAVTATVATPRHTRDLVRRLVRVRAGNAAMREAAVRGDVPAGVRRSARASWLRDVVLPRPWLAPAAVCYVVITIVAALLASGRRDAGAWARDESSRRATHEATAGR
ncbi:glycosyltransferase family 2 protein [Micromonospora sp. NPDC047548]|uniref:glycosyltransferase n=1 Tax=Micromonospora sp. NPDC047548 TaxID=3155624 RepID=UPI003408BE09